MSEENQGGAKKDPIHIEDVETPADQKLAYTKTFTVEYIDEAGKRVFGQFTVKRATLGDISQFGILKAQRNASLVVDRGIDWMNEMIAWCLVTLTDVPKWWDPDNMFDQNVLFAVYKKVKSFQDSFRKDSVVEQRSAAPPDSGATA